MDAPSYLAPSEMGDKKTSMLQYQPRLDGLEGVNTPETQFVPSDVDAAVDAIHNEMERRGWRRAFLRSPYKAAPRRLRAGSFIQRAERPHIRSTVESLHVQLSQSPWPVGEQLVLRERLDLSFCLNPSHVMEHPEIRFFVEGGDVLGQTPEQWSSDNLCAKGFDYLKDTIDNATPPKAQAERVASEFSNRHWCADFVMTTGGVWYCVELNFGGVRWDEQTERWRNMCGYGSEVAYSPEVIHQPVIRRYFPTG